MAEETNIRVIFTKKSDQIVSDIEQKYHLQESGEEFSKKGTAGKFSKTTMVIHLTSDFAKGKISEKELADFIQKETEVPLQTAEQMTKDVITNLVPSLKKISEEELAKMSEEEKDALMYGPAKKTEEPAAAPKMRAPIEVEKILAEKQGQPPKRKIKGAPIKKISAEMPDNGLEETTKSVARQPKKPDTYREPIE